MQGRRCSTSFQALAHVVGPNAVRRGARAGGLRAERRSALRVSFDCDKAAVRCTVIGKRAASTTKLRQRMVVRNNLSERNEAGMLLKTKDLYGRIAEQIRNVHDNKGHTSIMRECCSIKMVYKFVQLWVGQPGSLTHSKIPDFSLDVSYRRC